MVHNKKILLVPLDWGLGHTTRCIPVISALIENGHEVIIGGNAKTNALLADEFPQLQYETLEGYNIRYVRNPKWLPWQIIKQLPKIWTSVKREHRWLLDMHSKYKLDAVISDNRFGLYHADIKSIFITHQLNIQAPQSTILQWLVNKVNHYYLNKFEAIWIPDIEKTSIAGLLSESKYLKFHHPEHIRYVGPLSRFQFQSQATTTDIDILFILSGPEPQRTLLEEKIASEFNHHKANMVLVRGLPEGEASIPNKSFTIYKYCATAELQHLILRSKKIVSRAGYSSIMDYLTLRKTALLIPTPGQTEQEYLAKHLAEQGWFATVKQSESILKALPQLDQVVLPIAVSWPETSIVTAIAADIE